MKYAIVTYTSAQNWGGQLQGGAATALSEKCLKDSWVVYGVAWDENFQGAHYERISSVNELKALSGTKYVQARKGKIYSKVKKKFGCWRKSYFLWLAL